VRLAKEIEIRARVSSTVIVVMGLFGSRTLRRNASGSVTG
jgi:hypothetical protein